MTRRNFAMRLLLVLAVAAIARIGYGLCLTPAEFLKDVTDFCNNAGDTYKPKDDAHTMQGSLFVRDLVLKLIGKDHVTGLSDATNVNDQIDALSKDASKDTWKRLNSLDDAKNYAGIGRIVLIAQKSGPIAILLPTDSPNEQQIAYVTPTDQGKPNTVHSAENLSKLFPTLDNIVYFRYRL